MKYFGTDGVRGVAGEELTAELAFRLARAAGMAFGPGRVLLAQDTRVSGPALACACAAGLCEAGSDVVSAGVLPSPAVSHLVARGEFTLGVVISASHNPPDDNGIKLYGPRGTKLDPEDETHIESLLDRATARGSLGICTNWPGAEGAYRTLLLDAMRGLRLDGVKIVLDCAHGATTGVAPDVFRELGATLSLIGAEPDGTRINATGATHTQPLAELVRAEGADIGIAYDGDGDRAVFVDATGTLVEGDRLMAGLAPHLSSCGALCRPAVVFTELGNLGAEEYLCGLGFEVLRVPVGDRHVAHAMEQANVDLGGEPSGHIVFRRHGPTGDGILTSLQVLASLRRSECDLRELVREVPVYPQVRLDIPVADQYAVMLLPEVQRAVRDAQASLDGGGRLVVRPSGTQHLVRIMAEGPDVRTLETLAQKLAELIRSAR